MLKAIILLMASLCAFSQIPGAQPSGTASPEAAPADVDSALRKRVNIFYQAHVEGKFRSADQVVAEESKDWFFSSNKPKYDSFEIKKISYGSDFKSAEVVVEAKSTWVVRGQTMPVTTPQNSTWKIVDGQWFLFQAPIRTAVTPFGVMHFDSEAKPAAGGTVLPADPAVLAQGILSQVRIDRSTIQLNPNEKSSGEVKVLNGMPGPARLRYSLDGTYPWLTVKCDKTTLGPKESAVLTVEYDPTDKAARPNAELVIGVEPTSQMLNVKIVFVAPPASDTKPEKQP